MKFRCDGCAAQYAIPDEKVRGRRLDFPCQKCRTVTVLYGPGTGTPAEVAYLYVRHALERADRGEHDVALRTVGRAVTLFELEAPDDLEGLAAARHARAVLLDRAGRPGQAADAHPGVVDLYEQLVGGGRADLRALLVEALLDAADTARRVGRGFVAVALGTRASRLLGEMAGEGGETLWPAMGRAAHQLAEALLDARNPAAARPQAAAAAQTRAALLGRHDSLHARFELAATALVLARALEGVGERVEACQEATRAAELLAPLARGRLAGAGEAWIAALSFRAERLADVVPRGRAQVELAEAMQELLRLGSGSGH